MTDGAPGAWSSEELIATVIAREVRDGDSVAVGTLAPVPAAGVLLATMTTAPRARVAILNHPGYWPFRNGSKEFYDYAQRGGFDLFFLSGGQIDVAGNLNLIAVGDPRHPDVRFPGGAGAAMLYYVTPRVVVFRTDHTPRIFVPRVDVVASPGSSPPDVVRPGGPHKCVTPLCVFAFDAARGRLVVESLHPGVTREELARRTGFAPQFAVETSVTPAPTEEQLRLLRTRVREELAPVYPRYAASAAR